MWKFRLLKQAVYVGKAITVLQRFSKFMLHILISNISQHHIGVWETRISFHTIHTFLLLNQEIGVGLMVQFHTWVRKEPGSKLCLDCDDSQWEFCDFSQSLEMNAGCERLFPDSSLLTTIIFPPNSTWHSLFSSNSVVKLHKTKTKILISPN
jgi:hypothetical protein